VIVTGEHVCEWVAPRTGGQYYKGSGSGIGLEKDGELIAGVLFDNYTGRSVQMHVAAIPGRRWMTKEYLRVCFDYPFRQLGVCKIIGIVDSTNEDALRFDRHLGFVEEAIIKDAGKHGDLHILSMTRQQCRFI
jgi:RimJ/RimL family protein N-acetyltransferase